MAEYTKDKEFSLGWMFGGTLLIFVVNWFANFVAIGVGLKSFWPLLGIELGSYAVGGFVIGWRSEGRTILEAGIAAILSIIIGVAVEGLPDLNALLAFVTAVPFAVACFGAWIGEMVQGNVIVRDD